MISDYRNDNKIFATKLITIIPKAAMKYGKYYDENKIQCKEKSASSFKVTL
jgi:hypothetical protein